MIVTAEEAWLEMQAFQRVPMATAIAVVRTQIALASAAESCGEEIIRAALASVCQYNSHSYSHAAAVEHVTNAWFK